MRRLLDLSTTVRSLDRRVRLNVAARADLECGAGLVYTGMGRP